MKKRALWTPRRQIARAGRRPGDVFRGALAEDYDGIGQFVLVSLAGSSVGSAYKARVAAGDFGGGRVIPRGTPVVIHSYRGQLEVFLGNIPRAACFIIDDFERTFGPQGWGPASSGFNWDGTETIDPDIVFSVSDGIGHYAIGASSLNSSENMVLEIPNNISLVFEEEHELSFRFRFSYVALAPGQIATIQIENAGWSYLSLMFIRFHSNPTGTNRGLIQVDTSHSLFQTVDKNDWVANEWYTAKLRTSINGTLLDAHAKVWSDSEAEPDWMVTTNGTGYEKLEPPVNWTDTLTIRAVSNTNPIIARQIDVDHIQVCLV